MLGGQLYRAFPFSNGSMLVVLLAYRAMFIQAIMQYTTALLMAGAILKDKKAPTKIAFGALV